MKYTAHIIIILLATVVFAKPSAEAQVQGSCISNILNYIDRMAEGNPRPEKGQTFFMHYVSENVPHEKFRSPVIRKEVKIYVTPSQTILESDDISVYKDDADIFAVVHPLKQVIWGQAGKDPELTADGMQEMARMQKEILTTGKVIQCKTIGSGENMFQKIELIPAAGYKDLHHITTMVILYSLQTEMINKMVISFEADQDVLTQIVTYQEVNFDYKHFKPITVKKKFLDKNGNLNQNYPGYTLVKN